MMCLHPEQNPLIWENQTGVQGAECSEICKSEGDILQNPQLKVIKKRSPPE